MDNIATEYEKFWSKAKELAKEEVGLYHLAEVYGSSYVSDNTVHKMDIVKAGQLEVGRAWYHLLKMVEMYSAQYGSIDTREIVNFLEKLEK